MHVTLNAGQQARLVNPAAQVWFTGAAVPVEVECPVEEIVPGVRLVGHHVRHGALALPAVVGVVGPNRLNYMAHGEVEDGWTVIGENGPATPALVTVFYANGKQQQYAPGTLVKVAAL